MRTSIDEKIDSTHKRMENHVQELQAHLINLCLTCYKRDWETSYGAIAEQECVSTQSGVFNAPTLDRLHITIIEQKSCMLADKNLS